jgi:hypothetical protein
MGLSLVVDARDGVILRSDDQAKNEYVREAFQAFLESDAVTALQVADESRNLTLEFTQYLIGQTYVIDQRWDRTKLLIYMFVYGAYFGIEFKNEVSVEWCAVNKKKTEVIYKGLPYNPEVFLEVSSMARSGANDLGAQQARRLVDDIRGYSVSDGKRKELSESLKKVDRQHGIAPAEGSVNESSDSQWKCYELMLILMGLDTPAGYHKALAERGDVHKKYLISREIPAGYPWEWDSNKVESEHEFIQLTFPNKATSVHWKDAPRMDDTCAVAMRNLSKASDKDSGLLKHQIHCILLYNLDMFLWHIGLGYENGGCVVSSQKLFDERVISGNHNNLRLSRVMRCLRLLGYAVLTDAIFKLIETRTLEMSPQPKALPFYKKARADKERVLLLVSKKISMPQIETDACN